ncbi:MAG: hypothetical protein ACXVXP_00165 [Mycobacteriaceae bacterium]
MTWRCIWDIPGTPFPAHADHATEVDAHRHALRLSAEIGGEVAVVALGGAESDSGCGVALGATEVAQGRQIEENGGNA